MPDTTENTLSQLFGKEYKENETSALSYKIRYMDAAELNNDTHAYEDPKDAKKALSLLADKTLHSEHEIMLGLAEGRGVIQILRSSGSNFEAAVLNKLRDEEKFTLGHSWTTEHPDGEDTFLHAVLPGIRPVEAKDGEMWVGTIRAQVPKGATEADANTPWMIAFRPVSAIPKP